MSSENDDPYRERLSPEQFKVARCGGTERAFTGKFWNHKADGHIRLRLLRRPALRLDDEVRLGHRLAELLRARHEGRRQGDRGREPRHAPRGGPLREVRRPPRATFFRTDHVRRACGIASTRPRSISCRAKGPRSEAPRDVRFRPARRRAPLGLRRRHGLDTRAPARRGPLDDRGRPHPKAGRSREDRRVRHGPAGHVPLGHGRPRVRDPGRDERHVRQHLRPAGGAARHQSTRPRGARRCGRDKRCS